MPVLGVTIGAHIAVLAQLRRAGLDPVVAVFDPADDLIEPRDGLADGPVILGEGDIRVAVTMVLPARNDDFAVGATSRSYYLDLLNAGVRIFEYQPGLLHTKSVAVDGIVTLIGSANMDRRSFELNYENNILLCDPALTAEMRARQDAYIADSRPITLADVGGWTWRKQLWNNALATLSPVL